MEIEKIKLVSLQSDQVEQVLNGLLQREMKPLQVVEIYNIIALLRSAQPIETKTPE